MKINLKLKKPLFYLLLPAFFIMAFLGFPPVVEPPLDKGGTGASHKSAGGE
jgi:hypothetical protein